MEYYAHKSEDGRLQTVKEHLDAVAEIAGEFAVDMFKDIAFTSGKYV